MSSATLLLCAIVSFTLDQASKRIARASARHLQAASHRGSFVRCGLNTRVSRGVFGQSSVMTALWMAELVALVALVEFVPAFGGVVAPIALGVALGGAAGNLFDRVRRGGVVDFIDVGRWPVFNLADVAIVTGILATTLSLL